MIFLRELLRAKKSILSLVSEPSKFKFL